MNSQRRDSLLVSAHTQAGVNFVTQLQARNIPFAVLINHDNEKEQLDKFGIAQLIEADTMENNQLLVPEFPVGNVYLFEKSAALCSRFIRLCRPWTSKSIYVIFHGSNQRTDFKSAGADHVLFSKSEDLSFLLND